MLKKKIRSRAIPRAIREKYFAWLVDHIRRHPEMRRKDWERLLRKLQQTDFRWTLDMDEDRAENGIGLRFRFGWEKDIEYTDIDICLNSRPCSVLEMMVALCLKMEVVMSEDEAGDRTGEWFWCMLKSLGLNDMCGARYDDERVEQILNRFMMREYSLNGHGGLFTVRNVTDDMRNIEIWKQMNMWMIERAG